ncbi:MAG: hypothetical protein AABX72_04530, partial [Nanoarchaeota archaeon]
SDNTPVPKIRTYNGTSFSAGLAINATTIATIGPLNISGAVEHVKLVSKPASNEIALVYATALDDLNVAICNGTHFSCEAPNVLEAGLHAGDYQKFDAAYEQVSGDLFIAWGFGTTADLRYGNKTANQCLFSTATLTTFAEIGQDVHVASQYGSNYVMISQANGGSADDMHAIAWDGIGLRASGPNDASIYASEAVPNRLVDSGWAGSSPYGLVVYSDAATNTAVDYHLYNITPNTWVGGGNANGMDFNASLTDEDNQIRIYSFLDENKSFVFIIDEAQDMWAKIYNGDTNAWSHADGGATLNASTSSLEFPVLDFAWQNFSQIIVPGDTTPPTWSNTQKNETTITQNDYVNFSVTWDDETALSAYIFSINQSLIFVNSTARTLSGTSAIASNITQITAATGTNVSWKFYANDTSGNWNATEVQTFVVSANVGMLNATLLSPLGINSQPANQTFTLQANVTCIGEVGATCGTVNGTVRYNQSATNPNTAITGNNVFASPFYAVQKNPISCGALNVGSIPCNTSWIINATGAVGSTYHLDVNFTSETGGIVSNRTNFTVINIIAPAFSISISQLLANVAFGASLNPGSINNPALNNTNNAYNVTCDNPSGNCNITITGNDHMRSGSNIIGINNVSWSQTNNVNTEKNLTLSLQIINNTLPNLLSQLLYFWLDIPGAIPAGTYRSNFTIQGTAS